MQRDVIGQVYPWQQQVWENLTGRFPKMGHGLLFFGKQGCGKESLCTAICGLDFMPTA